jgi:hypothetical protein
MQTGLLMTEIWEVFRMGRNLQYYSGKNRIPCGRKRVLAYSKLKKEKKKDYSGRIEIKMLKFYNLSNLSNCWCYC